MQLCFPFLSWYSRYGVFADEVLFWRYRFLRVISLAVWGSILLRGVRYWLRLCLYSQCPWFGLVLPDRAAELSPRSAVLLLARIYCGFWSEMGTIPSTLMVSILFSISLSGMGRSMM